MTQVSQASVPIEVPMGRGSVDKGKRPMQTPSQGTAQLPGQSAVGRGQGRVFTLNPQEVHASTTAVIGTLLVDKLKARVLFDSGATHSFISPYFAKTLARDKVIMKSSLAIGIPVGKTIEVKYVFPACVIEIDSKVYPVDLIELDVLDFDVVLGMDWLSENYASIDCRDKCVRFKTKESIDFVFQGERSEVLTRLILVIRVRRSLDMGCQGFLAYVINGEVESIDV